MSQEWDREFKGRTTNGAFWAWIYRLFHVFARTVGFRFEVILGTSFQELLYPDPRNPPQFDKARPYAWPQKLDHELRCIME